MSDRTDPSVMLIFAAVSLVWLLPVLIAAARALTRRRTR